MAQHSSKNLTIILGGVLALLLGLIGWQAASRLMGPPCEPTRVLFIGNSYTYGHELPKLLEELAESHEPERCVETAMVAAGGVTLRNHWDQGQASEAIHSGEWDYVVLQEQSQTPLISYSDMAIYASYFDAEIDAAGARTTLYLTWSRRDAPETQAALTAAYRGLGGELDALVVPAGEAWHDPALQGLQLYEPDGSHPTLTGAYLTACVFYAAIFQESPEGLTNLTDLGDDQARRLQQAAWHAAQVVR